MRLSLLAAFLLYLLTACAPTPAADTLPPTPTLAPGVLVATWVDGGSLFAWRAGDAPTQIAEGDVVRPVMSPTGQHIAFTRGQDGQQQTLWVTNFDGSVQQELVPQGRIQPVNGTIPQLHDVLWLDDATLLFTSARASGDTIQPHNDLYRVDIAEGALSTLLTPGQGGVIALSPDHTQIALARSSASGRGSISLLDPTTERTRQLLDFTNAPATPRIEWSRDGSVLRAAVPEAGDGANATVHLWTLAPDEPAREMGTVQALADALPVWSWDGSRIAFLQAGEGDSVSLMIADSNGTNPVTVATAPRESFSAIQPVPESAGFAYRTNDGWMLARPGTDPEPLPGDSAYFPGGGYVVYADDENSTALHYAPLDQPDSASLIAEMSAAPTALDVAYVR